MLGLHKALSDIDHVVISRVLASLLFRITIVMHLDSDDFPIVLKLRMPPYIAHLNVNSIPEMDNEVGPARVKIVISTGSSSEKI